MCQIGCSSQQQVHRSGQFEMHTVLELVCCFLFPYPYAQQMGMHPVQVLYVLFLNVYCWVYNNTATNLSLSQPLPSNNTVHWNHGLLMLHATTESFLKTCSDRQEYNKNANFPDSRWRTIPIYASMQTQSIWWKLVIAINMPNMIGALLEVQVITKPLNT